MRKIDVYFMRLNQFQCCVSFYKLSNSRVWLLRAGFWYGMLQGIRFEHDLKIGAS